MAKRVLKRRKRRISVPKECYFCKEKKEPSFWEAQVLQRFLTERGKITGAARNGFCAKHQRALSRNVKYGRHLALLPFVVRG